MDNQTYQILQFLYPINNFFITYKYIADTLNLSTRTINRKMPEVLSFLSENKLNYEVKRSKGIKLKLTEIERHVFQQKLTMLKPSYFSKDDRIIFIILELLSAKEPVKIDYFAKSLKVSSSTIQTDLDDIKEKAYSLNLHLRSERGKGLYLEGNLSSKIIGKTTIIFENVDFSKLNMAKKKLITSDSFQNSLSPLIREKLHVSFSIDMVNEIHNSLEKEKNQLRFLLADGSYIKLLIGLSDFVRATFPKKVRLEKIKNKYIVNLIRKMFPEEELYSKETITFLSNFLESARYTDSVPKNKNKKILENNAEETKQLLLNELLVEFSNDIDLSSKFIPSLDYHLSLFIKRYDTNLQIPNQYTQNFIRDYNSYANRVRKILKKLNFTNIIDDEVVYIAMHLLGASLEKENKNRIKKIAVVCYSGFGTAQVLKETLKSKLHEIDIHVINDLDNINELEFIKNGIKLVVSTISVETTFIPSVFVNPFLTDLDIKKIEEKLEMDNKKKEMNDNLEVNVNSSTTEKSKIEKIVENYYYKELNSVINLESLVKKIASDNVPLKEVIPLTEKLIEREKFGSSVIDEHGIILLHCKFRKRTSLGVIRINNPFRYETSDNNQIEIDTVIFMVVPEEKGSETIELFSKISSEIVTNEGFIKELKQQSSALLSATLERVMSRNN